VAILLGKRLAVADEHPAARGGILPQLRVTCPAAHPGNLLSGATIWGRTPEICRLRGDPFLREVTLASLAPAFAKTEHESTGGPHQEKANPVPQDRSAFRTKVGPNAFNGLSAGANIADIIAPRKKCTE
jgi:hypothetical protein